MLAIASLNTPWGPAEKVGTAAINVSSSGDNTVLAGTSGYICVVLGYVLLAAGTVVVTFKDSTPATLSGPYTVSTSSGNFGDCSTSGLQFVAASGKDLILNLGGAVQVGGHLLYALVKG